VYRKLDCVTLKTGEKAQAGVIRAPDCSPSGKRRRIRGAASLQRTERARIGAATSFGLRSEICRSDAAGRAGGGKAAFLEKSKTGWPSSVAPCN
jgi:hypothetical protein